MQLLIHTLWGHPLAARRVPGGPALPCPARCVLVECGPPLWSQTCLVLPPPEGTLPRAGCSGAPGPVA